MSAKQLARMIKESDNIVFFGGKHFVVINKQETPYDYRAELIVRENIGEFPERTMAEY